MNHKDEICWPHPWTVDVGLLKIPHCFAILATMVLADLLQNSHVCFFGIFDKAMVMQSRNGNGWTWLSQSNAAYTILIYTYIWYMIYIYIYKYRDIISVIYKYIYIYPGKCCWCKTSSYPVKCGSFITSFYTKTAAGVADVEWAWGERWDLVEESHQVSWLIYKSDLEEHWS